MDQKNERRPRLKKAWRVMKSEGSATAKAGARMAVISLVMGGVGLMALSSLLPKPKPIEDGSTLYVSLDRPLTEWSPSDDSPAWQFVLGKNKLSANAIADAIKDAGADDRIERLILDLDGLEGTPLGAATKVRDALTAFRASGKPATVYASNYGNAAYLIAAAAEDRVMHPMGMFDVGRFGVGTLYMGEAFERWGVDVAVGKAGRYKSAVEPYLLKEMSEEAATAAESFLTDRGMGYAATLGVDLPDEWQVGRSEASQAVEQNLVDRTLAAPDLMAFAFGDPLEAERNYTTLHGYFGARDKPNRCELAQEGDPAAVDGADRIGVITLEGQITRGASESGSIGAVTVTEQIETMIRDEDIRALVVRIASPGGDAVASEIIRSELESFKATGRPVIVSMGSVAASGGYWIATVADTILAEPTTLTGSIGVFSIRPSTSPMLAEFGVRYDGVTVGPDTRFGSLLEPVQEAELAWMQGSVDRIYGQFVGIVADARGLDTATAPEWAEGRVWGAHQALQIGLVDTIGGYDDALELAAAAAQVPSSCTVYAKSRSRTGSILTELLSAAAPSMKPPMEVPEEVRMAQTLLAAGKPVIQATCLLCGTD